MNRSFVHFVLTVSWAFSVSVPPVSAQLLEPRWQKDFPNKVDWYVRTSPGVLIVRSGKTLTALDGLDGRQLWTFPDVELSGSAADASVRFTNVVEVPGAGVLLLDRARMPGDSGKRLIAVNLISGERLWDIDQGDPLYTAVPINSTPDAVLVSTRLQKKILAAQVAAEVAIIHFIPYAPLAPALDFYRYELKRIDLRTGKVVWSSEYPQIFAPTTSSMAVFGGTFIIYLGDALLGSVNLADGKRLWQQGSKIRLALRPVLAMLWVNDHLVFGTDKVQSVNPETNAVIWEIGQLGKLSGLVESGGVVAAIGNSHLAAVDSATGKELWRHETHGNTTNLLYDKTADSLLYIDSHGLHAVARKTGAPLFDAPVHEEGHPILISLAGPDQLAAISTKQVSGYNTRTGKKLFDAGEPVNFYSSTAIPASPVLPFAGQEFSPWTKTAPDAAPAESTTPGGFLTSEWRARLSGFRGDPQGATDVYETASETGFQKVWWIDPASGQKVEVGVAGQQHEVSLSLGMVFAIDGKQVWGAAIKPK